MTYRSSASNLSHECMSCQEVQVHWALKGESNKRSMSPIITSATVATPPLDHRAYTPQMDFPEV